MITIYGGGTSRSMRVTWLLEEMGLPYRIRPVNLLSDAKDQEFLALNPAGYIPVLKDGDVTMVESIAILEYLVGRYGPTPLAPAPCDPAFPAYQQFLHLGEAGLATLMMTPLVSRHFAPEAERDNWGAGLSLRWVENRLKLVQRQLEQAPYMAGEHFTAADISVTYALGLGQSHVGIELTAEQQAYRDRTTVRDAYKRAYAVEKAAVVG